MKSFLRRAFKIAVYVFACIGLAFAAVFIGMRLHLFDVRGSIDERNKFFLSGSASAIKAVATKPCLDDRAVCAWNETPEWSAISSGLRKDSAAIIKASTEVGVSPRMVAAVIVPEQTRFFTAERDTFKRYFEPLKILGTMSQFSLGVSGIKQETADNIEKYAADPTSEFYPGDSIAALLAYPEGSDHDKELYRRLTDSHDHYYQYLYTAVYVREIQAQWQRAGFDVSKSPEVIVTLFNLGFQASHPNAEPKAAGTIITTGGEQHIYGVLGSEFYRSLELVDVFPQD